jgi:hypothetical protein
MNRKYAPLSNAQKPRICEHHPAFTPANATLMSLSALPRAGHIDETRKILDDPATGPAAPPG